MNGAERQQRPLTSSLARVAGVLALTGILVQCADRAPEITAPSDPLVSRETSVPAEPETLALPMSGACFDGQLPSGALWRVCLPLWWNGGLTVYAPGYLSVYDELRIRDDELNGISLREVATGLGFVFATTSYHKNGLVLPQATSDLVTLVGIANDIIASLTGGQSSRHVYLVGGSLGGLVTAKSVEAVPQVFSGGLAACGPYGRFRSQMDYVGDFRVVFDNLLGPRVQGWPVWRQNLGAGDPGRIDEGFRAAWESTFEPRVRAAVLGDPGRAAQVINVTRASIDGGNVANSTMRTITGVLWYHIFGTNDVLAVLGGQPFDNRNRIYFGSSNDFLLNLRVQRFAATGSALGNIASFYETSGNLSRPLVTLHTTGDEIVPYWHQLLYVGKASPWYRHTPIPISRYGHCNFTAEEVLAAFAILVLQASSQNLVVPESVLPDPDAQARFLALAREHGAEPRMQPAETQPLR